MIRIDQMSEVDLIRHVDEMSLDMSTGIQPNRGSDRDGTHSIAQRLSELHVWIKACIDVLGCERLQEFPVDQITIGNVRHIEETPEDKRSVPSRQRGKGEERTSFDS
jgi:hypothetical protein